MCKKRDIPVGQVAKDSAKIVGWAAVGTALGGPVGGLLGFLASTVLPKAVDYHTNPDYETEDDEGSGGCDD